MPPYDVRKLREESNHVCRGRQYYVVIFGMSTSFGTGRACGVDALATDVRHMILSCNYGKHGIDDTRYGLPCMRSTVPLGSIVENMSGAYPQRPNGRNGSYVERNCVNEYWNAGRDEIGYGFAVGSVNGDLMKGRMNALGTSEAEFRGAAAVHTEQSKDHLGARPQDDGHVAPRAVSAVGDEAREVALERTPVREGGSAVQPDHQRGGVAVSGTVPMLDLRGGGPQGRDGEDVSREGSWPPRDIRLAVLGAGVALWMEDDPQLLQLEAEYLVGQWIRTPISLFDALQEQAIHDQTAERPGRRVEPLIRGSRDGRDVVICVGCSNDFPQADAKDPLTGELRAWCRACRGIGLEAEVRGGQVDWYEKRLSDCPALGWSPGVDLNDQFAELHDPTRVGDYAGIYGHPAGESQSPATAAATTTAAAIAEAGANDVCQRCALDLHIPGVAWRICRCGATACEACAPEPCLACGAGEVWKGDHVPPSQLFGEGDTQRHSTPPAAELAGQEVALGICTPVVEVTPGYALKRRTDMKEERRSSRLAARAESNAARKKHIKEGCRLARPALREDRISVVTANATAASSLIRELKHGDQLRRAGFILVQEHGLHGEALERHIDELKGLGWQAVADPAYRKGEGYGGGTAILTADPHGIRPVQRAEVEHVGRVSLAIANFGREVLLISVYCISGASVVQQLQLLKYVSTCVRWLGIPFIAGGDAQVKPADLEKTGICRLLQASICAPDGPTTTKSKHPIDYFLVADELLKGTWQVQTSMDSAFKPHYPVFFSLRVARGTEQISRLVRPKPLPAERPIGPQLPGYKIKWEEWHRLNEYDREGINDTEQLDHIVMEWYAGAEMELCTVMGVAGRSDEVDYLGMGRPKEFVQSCAAGKYRHTDDQLGLIGHRLAWAARGLHMLINKSSEVQEFGCQIRTAHGWPRSWGRALHIGIIILRRVLHYPLQHDPPLPPLPPHMDYLKRIGHQAAAFAAQQGPSDRPEDMECTAAIRRAMQLLASLVQSTHGRFPGIERLCLGDVGDIIDRARKLYDELQDEMKKLAERRKSKSTAEVKRWAARAPLAVAHRATKAFEATTVLTASASKKHLGHRTAQRAADGGAVEWGPKWGDQGRDVAEEILEAMEAMEAFESLFPDIVMDPLDEDDMHRAGMQCRASTATGTDITRPRHVVLLSRAARRQLARILNLVERVMRWPRTARAVIAVALTKKSGGSRLVGVATAIYRWWARARYMHCRKALEQRIARPFLSAAPQRGAMKAAFELAFAAELAVSRNEQVATTMVDMAQFYENIRADEYFRGGRRFGVPAVILVLTTHLYLGPRHIRVREAYSRELFPAWSVLAGCTWATVHVRLLIIDPVERFLLSLNGFVKDWSVALNVNFYIDDGIASTTGAADSVAVVHARITRALIEFIRKVLKKDVVNEKIQCVATGVDLRKKLSAQLENQGIPVKATAETLGIDYTAGGPMTQLPAHAKRHVRGVRRYHKLAWWVRMKGRFGHQIARGGMASSSGYGGVVHGMSGKRLTEIRKVQASAGRVKSQSASLTARLAISGTNYEDMDPAVYIGSPALIAVASKLWDEPTARAGFAKAWLRARTELAKLHPARAWRAQRGPVGAAWNFLASIGASWRAPFRIELLGYEVDMLSIPPLQIKKIVAEHTRVRLDQALIAAVAEEECLPQDSTSVRYRHGVDWALVREVLRNKNGMLTPKEKWAFELTVTGAIWHEVRRWKGGYLPTGTCLGCFMYLGTAAHKRSCPAMQADLLMQNIAGRHQAPPEVKAMETDESMGPLLIRGLPPKRWGWHPVEVDYVEGSLAMGRQGIFYGDGSGRKSCSQHRGAATYSCIGPADSNSGDGAGGGQQLRGRVGGWFPTVPRAEISAYLSFLRHASMPSSYGGDCQHVIDIADAGIPGEVTSSASVNADLWREARRLAEDHDGERIRHVKIRAHRSFEAAAGEGPEAVANWRGNCLADHAAKSLLRKFITDNDCNDEREAADATAQVMARTAFAATWAMGKYPEATKKGAKRRKAGRGVIPQAGPHLLESRGSEGGFRCSRCKLVAATASSLRSLRLKPCRGDTAQQCHASHQLDASLGFVWCRKCGAYTSKVPRALRRPCPRRPATEAQANVLRRLLGGLAPTTAAYAAAVAQRARANDEKDHWDTSRAWKLSAAGAARTFMGFKAEEPQPVGMSVSGQDVANQTVHGIMDGSPSPHVPHQVCRICPSYPHDMHPVTSATTANGDEGGHIYPHDLHRAGRILVDGGGSDGDGGLHDDDGGYPRALHQGQRINPIYPHDLHRAGRIPVDGGGRGRDGDGGLHDDDGGDPRAIPQGGRIVNLADRGTELTHLQVAKGVQAARPRRRMASLSNVAEYLYAKFPRGSSQPASGSLRRRSNPSRYEDGEWGGVAETVRQDKSARGGLGTWLAHRPPPPQLRNATSSHSTVAATRRCTADRTLGWTRRIAVGRSWQPSPCCACECGTSARCKSCSQPLCLQCAKKGEACGQMSTA